MDQMTTHYVFNTLQTLVVQSFHLSVNTGKVLVDIMKFILENTIKAIQGGISVILAIVDSLEPFSRDWQQILLELWNFLETLFFLCLKLFLVLTYVFEEIISLFLALISGLKQGVSLIWNLMTHAIIELKSLIVLFGSGVWFALTFIPSLVICLTSSVFHYICNLKGNILNFVVAIAYDMRMSLYSFYQFITDVPLESLIGIMLAICLVYIFAVFYSVVFYYFHRQVQQLFSKLYRKIIRLRSQLSTSRNRPRTICSLRTKPRMSSDERYCIICTECLKCIVLLPCRHLCLCTECSEKVRRSNNSCPICRCYIEDRIKVFM